MSNGATPQKRETMYALYDTFNGRVISRHRTPAAVGRANSRFQRAVKRANGQSSYIPTTIKQRVSGKWEPCDQNTYDEAFSRGY